jgi:hypothetical protein
MSVRAFLCPDDPTGAYDKGMSVATYGGANYYGVTCYPANYLVFGNPNAMVSSGDPNPRHAQGAGSFDTTFRDGTSSTIIFAERYASCGSVSGGSPGSNFIYGCLWSDGGAYWRPTFCATDMSESLLGANSQPPNPPPAPVSPSFGAKWTCLTPQDNPDWITTCENRRTQSGHPGIINVCFGDGNVQSISTGVDATVWSGLCNPQDGNAITNGW